MSIVSVDAEPWNEAGKNPAAANRVSPMTPPY